MAGMPFIPRKRMETCVHFMLDTADPFLFPYQFQEKLEPHYCRGSSCPRLAGSYRILPSKF